MSDVAPMNIALVAGRHAIPLDGRPLCVPRPDGSPEQFLMIAGRVRKTDGVWEPSVDCDVHDLTGEYEISVRRSAIVRASGDAQATVESGNGAFALRCVRGELVAIRQVAGAALDALREELRKYNTSCAVRTALKPSGEHSALLKRDAVVDLRASMIDDEMRAADAVLCLTVQASINGVQVIVTPFAAYCITDRHRCAFMNAPNSLLLRPAPF